MNQLTSTVVSLDWNENPLGPSPSAVARVREAASAMHRYPRGLLEQVSDQLAAYLGVASGELLLTAGVDEAVDLVLSLATHAYVVSPGFDGYLARAQAVWPVPVTALALDDHWQPSAIPHTRATGSVGLLAQPNNPTGNMFRRSWIDEFRLGVERLMLDATYAEFCPSSRYLYQARHPGTFIFRSFSKAFGLAGMRLGCLVGEASEIRVLAERRRFQPVDTFSLHALSGTLSDAAHIERSVAATREAAANLARILERSSLFDRVVTTDAGFIIGETRGVACEALVGELGARGVRVRNCASLGLPGWIRVSGGTVADQSRLEAALALLAEGVTV